MKSSNYKYEDITIPEGYEDWDGNYVDTSYFTMGYFIEEKDLQALALTYEQFTKYAKEKTVYAWHIERLEIFDKPKELSEFGLKRAPQRCAWVEKERK